MQHDFRNVLLTKLYVTEKLDLFFTLVRQIYKKIHCGTQLSYIITIFLKRCEGDVLHIRFVIVNPSGASSCIDTDLHAYTWYNQIKC